jgi:hypothetical protein
MALSLPSQQSLQMERREKPKETELRPAMQWAVRFRMLFQLAGEVGQSRAALAGIRRFE